MRKKLLISVICIGFLFIMVALEANFLATLGVRIRPDFYIYPIYKTSVAKEELLLQQYVNAICAQERCQQRYSVKVFKWSIWKYYDTYMVWQNEIIFVKQNFINNFSEDEKKFIMGHEIGHHVLKTNDDIEADSFAVKYSTKLIGIETLRKISFLAHLKDDEVIQIFLQKRIRAIEKGGELWKLN